MNTPPPSYPKEGVQRSVLHDLCEDHDGTGRGDDALQVYDVGVLELAHDGGLRQEVPPLLVCVAALQGLDGYVVLLSAWNLQPAPTHLPKLPHPHRDIIREIGRKRERERGRETEGRGKGEEYALGLG